jgi:hypothetical protein
MRLWEHPTLNIQRPTSNGRHRDNHWMLEVGCWLLNVPMKRRTESQRPTQRAYLLIEALVYIALIGAVLSIGYTAMYRCLDSSIALRRNADDIVSALQAGERWRADIRAATSQPRAELIENVQLLRLDSPRGPVTYRFGTNGVSRQLAGGGWVNLLPRVKSSSMIADPREHTTAWRWELELQPRVTASIKPGHLRPLFTFIAVPQHAPIQ